MTLSEKPDDLVLSITIGGALFNESLSTFQTHVLNQLLTMGEDAERIYNMRSTEQAIRGLPEVENE